MFKLQEPYEPRPIRFLELWEYAGWRMKVYSIAYGRESARTALIDAAKVVAQQRLPLPAVTNTRYGAGFLGVHDGRGANFVFVDWWANENELFHYPYSSPTDEPDKLAYVGEPGISVCVWDLRVQIHEREAWLACVLQNSAGPDIDGYLAQHLNINA